MPDQGQRSGRFLGWSIGVLECWSVGVLECWSVGQPERPPAKDGTRRRPPDVAISRRPKYHRQPAQLSGSTELAEVLGEVGLACVLRYRGAQKRFCTEDRKDHKETVSDRAFNWRTIHFQRIFVIFAVFCADFLLQGLFR